MQFEQKTKSDWIFLGKLTLSCIFLTGKIIFKHRILEGLIE